MLFVFFPLVVVIILLVVTNIRIVPQSQAYVIERLGAYMDTWEVGLRFHLSIELLKKYR